MTKIAYRGLDNERILDAADLKRRNHEGFKKTVFVQHEAVEVDDEIAFELTSNPEIYGNFEVVEQTNEVEGSPTTPDSPPVEVTETEGAAPVDQPATGEGEPVNLPSSEDAPTEEPASPAKAPKSKGAKTA